MLVLRMLVLLLLLLLLMSASACWTLSRPCFYIPRVETANETYLPRRATRLTVWPRWPSRAKAGKTASALRFADLMSTDSTCSSSSATWNDVRFELKHRARMGAT